MSTKQEALDALVGKKVTLSQEPLEPHEIAGILEHDGLGIYTVDSPDPDGSIRDFEVLDVSRIYGHYITLLRPINDDDD